MRQPFYNKNPVKIYEMIFRRTGLAPGNNQQVVKPGSASVG